MKSIFWPRLVRFAGGVIADSHHRKGSHETLMVTAAREKGSRFEGDKSFGLLTLVGRDNQSRVLIGNHHE